MATFWDEDGTSGWAETAVKAAKPVTAKPSKEEMQAAWNENRNDPAKIHELMQTYGVGVRDVAGILGASQSDVAAYLNTGRKAQSVRSGAGDDLEIRDVYNYDEVTPEPQTKDEFMATVEPWMLDAQGKFKAPKEGVNFMLEGMTPAEAYQTAQGILSAGDWSEDNRLGKQNSKAQADALLDPGWREGPDNGGGVLGGLARGVGNIATGVAKNPALLAAASAGIGEFFAPASAASASPYAISNGTGTFGSASAASTSSAMASPGIGATAAGLTGSTASALQTYGRQVLASPYGKPVINAAKTLVGGGDLKDAALSAGGSYLGGQTSDALGGGAVGNIGGSVVSGVVSGKDPLQVLISSGTNAAAGMITGNVPGFEALSPSQQSAVNSMVASALKGKSPTQALIANVTKLATGQVASAKTQVSNTKTGGWAA